MDDVTKRMKISKRLVEKLQERETALSNTCLEFVYSEEDEVERKRELKRVCKLSKDINGLVRDLRSTFSSPDKWQVIRKLDDNEMVILTVLFLKSFSSRLPVRLESRHLGELILGGKAEAIPHLLRKDSMLLTIFARLETIHSSRGEGYAFNPHLKFITEFFLD